MYKTIVVHVDQGADAAARIAAAAQLAVRFGAHLVGTAVTGLAPSIFPVGGFVVAPPLAPYPIDALRAQAEAALDAFEVQAGNAGVASFERRRVDDEAGIGLGMQSRYCDLLVAGRSATSTVLPASGAGYPESVLMHSTCPVLLVPAQGAGGTLGAHVTIAWNGSANAARAVRSAIALLRNAARVDLVVYNPDHGTGLHGTVPGADLAGYLAHHGIVPVLMVREAPSNPGEALLAHATERGSDLIVMGAFGHSRFRELVLGGTTRSVLHAATVPLWMVH